MQINNRERVGKMVLGLQFTFSGVAGGKFLSKTSGDKAGPMATDLRRAGDGTAVKNSGEVSYDISKRATSSC